jgi:tetratricopeptide (TPR) repeat protein
VLFETLAKWYGGEKRYTEALQTWEHIETQFGHNSSSGLHKFELLWALKHIRQAHQLWVVNKQEWREKANARQLALMAEIAWLYKQTKTALSYYNQLLQQRYKRSAKEYELQYMRVALLNQKLGRTSIALSTYHQGFIKTRHTNLLINGLQLSFDRGDMRNFTRLTTLAKKYKRQFKSKSRYWLLQAAYAQRNKNYRTALNYYKTVLSLRPKSREAKTGITAIRKHLRSI